MTKEQIPGLKILFEDDSIVALDKPAGIVVNRSSTHVGITVQDYIESNFKLIDDTGPDTGQALNPEGQPYPDEFLSRSGVVHRLDKDTSGVLIVAKIKSAFKNLQLQFKSREVHKEYHCVVVGGDLPDKFQIDAPLDRNPKSRLTMAVTVEGRPAKTTFERIKYVERNANTYSYLSATPLTGRTHQIRVHLAALNHPVAGDQIYCSKMQLQITTEAFGRMMLHALSIQFTHPVGDQKIDARAPLPEEFLKL
jgi:23S rRNA pseudouridine1911/1915/1917 synthase